MISDNGNGEKENNAAGKEQRGGAHEEMELEMPRHFIKLIFER